MTEHPDPNSDRQEQESYHDALPTGLEREGYDVQLAADGMEGLRLFTEKAPDIVLLDVMLPDIRGSRCVSGCKRCCRRFPL